MGIKKDVKSFLGVLRDRWKDMNDEILRRRLSGVDTTEFDGKALELIYVIEEIEKILNKRRWW